LQIVQEFPKRANLARHVELSSKRTKVKNSKINFRFFCVATTLHFLLVE